MTTQTIFKTVGQASQSCDISLVQNAASTAAGDPILGLGFNTTNLVCWYRIPPLGSVTQITLATLATLGTAYSSGGFLQTSATNQPGQYRFDIPNACLASAGECNITFSGAPAGTAGNMETHTLKIIVLTVDLFASGSIYAQTMQTQMTESYAAHTVVPTPEQAANMMLAFLTNNTIAGTTGTVKKRDNSTTAMTITYNAASNASALSQTGP